MKFQTSKWDRVVAPESAKNSAEMPALHIATPKVVKVDEQPIPDHVEPIIRRLVETRRAWKLSISEVAERCGGDWNTFVRYERGDKFPSAKTLLRWADVLGFELSLWPKKS